MIICNTDKCTGCGLCSRICKKNAIKIVSDNEGNDIYKIDESLCVNCGACKRFCPNNEPVKKCLPNSVYAAYAKDKELYSGAASGGVASVFYTYALEKNISFFGANFNKHNHLEVVKGNSKEDIIKFRGSKYVKSDAGAAYESVKKELALGRKVIFVGLPCQVAALRKYTGEVANLITVDLVCHGAPPQIFLQDYLSTFKDKKKAFDELRFRENGNFIFGLYKNQSPLYRKPSYKDLYMYSFLKGITYSRSCYTCNYACKERVSDITICDFWGFECEGFIKDKVSAVMINTPSGEKFWNDCCEYFYYIKTTLNEVVKMNAQLRHPSIEHPYRKKFLQKYSKHHSFRRALLGTRIWVDILKFYIKDIIRYGRR